MKKIIITFLCLALFCSTVSAQSVRYKLQQAADEYLKTHKIDEGITSVTVSVYSPKLDKTETVTSGYIDNLLSKITTTDNLYQIGSITKSFTAVILLQLEAESIGFSIDDKISKYLPQYPKWKDVTVKQLLNMTSGIPSYTDNEKFWQDFSRHPYHNVKPEQIIDYVYNQPSSFNPGEGWYYNNTGFIMAGMIIEKITGHTVEEEINHRFLKPENSSHLILNNSLYLTHGYTDAIYQRMVHGYIHKKKHARHFSLNADTTNFTLTWAGAAGVITGTPSDVINWAQALYTSTDLLPEAQRKKLTACVSMVTGKPIDESKVDKEIECFGLGIGKLISSEGVAYTYEGSTLGYRVVYLYIPSTRIVVSVAVNSSEEIDHIDDLIDKAYSIIKH